MNHRRGHHQTAANPTFLDTDTTTNSSSVTDIESSSDNNENSNNMSDAVAEFDALRREATKLERHLEDKVAKYQQLAQRLMTGDNDNHNHNHNNNNNNHRSSSLLESAETGMLNHDGEESSLSSDISRTISAMSDLVNDRMSPAAERTGRGQHALLVKRYREILFDRSADFNKTSAAVARRRESRELFRKRNGTLAGGGTGGAENDSDTDSLLRERGAISNSLSSARNVIGQAEEIRSDLRSQGSSLRGVSGMVANIAGQVPGLNHVIDNIRRKRGRDDMIVGGVVSGCILFTLWYVFVA